MTAIDHRYTLAIEVEASSFSDLADRLRDLATDIDIGQAAPRSLFAGAGSRGHYTLTDREAGPSRDIEAPSHPGSSRGTDEAPGQSGRDARAVDPTGGEP